MSWCGGGSVLGVQTVASDFSWSDWLLSQPLQEMSSQFWRDRAQLKRFLQRGGYLAPVVILSGKHEVCGCSISPWQGMSSHGGT